MSGDLSARAGRMRRILLLIVALILYGSLYPWHFHFRYLAVGPLWILLHSWPVGINRYVAWDVAVNLALYLPLGVAAYLSIGARARSAVRIIAPLLLALALSVSVEMLQIYDVSRECSILDVASNVTGAAVGVALGSVYRRKFERVLERRETAALLHLSGALLLLCSWLGYQLFPLFPALGRTKLAAKFAAMGPLSGISASAAVLECAEWIAVACLLDALLEERTARAFALLLLVLPARLVIVGRTLAWEEIVGALAAYGVWMAVPRRQVRRAAPYLLSAALLLNEFAPFRFARAGAFNWVPFRGFFEARWQSVLVVLFRKTFWYGSVIWLWCAARYRLARVTVLVAGALFLLELVQKYVPGRTPEITDAVLALLAGLLLWLLRPAEPRHT